MFVYFWNNIRRGTFGNHPTAKVLFSIWGIIATAGFLADRIEIWNQWFIIIFVECIGQLSGWILKTLDKIVTRGYIARVPWIAKDKEVRRFSITERKIVVVKNKDSFEFKTPTINIDDSMGEFHYAIFTNPSIRGGYDTRSFLSGV